MYAVKVVRWNKKPMYIYNTDEYFAREIVYESCKAFSRKLVENQDSITTVMDVETLQKYDNLIWWSIMLTQVLFFFVTINETAHNSMINTIIIIFELLGKTLETTFPIISVCTFTLLVPRLLKNVVSPLLKSWLSV